MTVNNDYYLMNLNYNDLNLQVTKNNIYYGKQFNMGTFVNIVVSMQPNNFRSNEGAKHSSNQD